MEIQRPNRLRKASIGKHSNGDIPDWLLFEILLRLPPDSVCARKIVSQQWLSTASDPNFIRAYISRASISPPSWTIVPDYFDRVSLDTNPLNYIMPRDLYLQPRVCKLFLPCSYEGRNFLIMGVSDGLVLYCSYSYTEIDQPLHFYVSNPITGQWTTCCGRTGFLFKAHGWGFLTRVDQGGVLKSYRIVIARVEHMKPTSFLNFWVYYSEFSEWKKFTMPNPHGSILFSSQESAALLDGILHWPYSNLGVMIAYDPDRNPEHIRTIKLPRDDASSFTKAHSLCASYRGKLRYLRNAWSSQYVHGFMRFKIWELDDYDSGEWCLRHQVVGTGGIWSGIKAMEPLFFDHFDEDVAYFRLIPRGPSAEVGVVSYNLKTEALVVRDEMVVRDGPFYVSPWRMSQTFVFVVPPWPTIVADHHLERRRGSSG